MPKFYLVTKIEEALKDEGYVEAIIYGKRGIGKSVYALKVAHQAYVKLANMHPDDAWNEVLNRIVFHIAGFVMRVSQFDISKRLEIIIMDDAGFWLSTFNPHSWVFLCLSLSCKSSQVN